MPQSDSTQNNTNTIEEHVISLDRARQAKRFYSVQEQDVFQQRLDGLIERVAHERNLTSELFDFLIDLRRGLS